MNQSYNKLNRKWLSLIDKNAKDICIMAADTKTEEWRIAMEKSLASSVWYPTCGCVCNLDGHPAWAGIKASHCSRAVHVTIGCCSDVATLTLPPALGLTDCQAYIANDPRHEFQPAQPLLLLYRTLTPSIVGLSSNRIHFVPASQVWMRAGTHWERPV